MTQEEKAKAYDEALEKAKEMINNSCSSETTKVACIELFPKLAESEDERVRRTLAEYFGPKVQLDFVRGVPIKKIRDWLEKQKEHKPAEWSEEDEKIRKTLLDYYEKALDNYTCVEWLNGITYGELCDWLKSLRPSWKPSEKQMTALLNIEGDLRAFQHNDKAKIIAELYEQLKRIKEDEK